MNFLKNNLLTFVLCLGLFAYIWRSNSLAYQLRMSDSNAQKKFIIERLSEVKKEIEETRLKSVADSVQREEVLKSLPKYEKNLSHSRLIAIRDSLRARHNLPNR